MINIENTLYIFQIKTMTDYIPNFKFSNEDNILNINAEKLYREAEDDFFYFNKSKSAEKKLKEALKHSPCQIKILKFLGDIYFASGKMEKAFDYYSQAAALKPADSVILASLSSVCEVLEKYETALQFADLAFKNLSPEDVRIYASLSNLKVSLLVDLQKYSEAKTFLDFAKKRLSFEESGRLSSSVNQNILKKKLALKERMKKLNIKVV